MSISGFEKCCVLTDFSGAGGYSTLPEFGPIFTQADLVMLPAGGIVFNANGP